MRNSNRVKSVNSKSVNPNDVEGAALALVALEITQPRLMDEDEDEYCNLVNRIYEDYCPLFRVPSERRTAEESEVADAMQDAIGSKVDMMLDKLQASKDPLFRALAVRQQATAE